MAGKGKSMVEYDWLIAYQVGFKNGDIPYCELLSQSSGSNAFVTDHYRGEKHLVLQSHNINQETIVMKKELVDKLSFEAKNVISLLLDSPTEVTNSFATSKYQCVSKEKIKTYLMTKMKWPKKKVLKIFKELRGFTKELDELEQIG